jgi:hypothetical protein
MRDYDSEDKSFLTSKREWGRVRTVTKGVTSLFMVVSASFPDQRQSDVILTVK